MRLERLLKKAERSDFLAVFLVLAAIALYLRLARAPAPEARPALDATAASAGMDRLWLEAALAKPDVRPVNDEVRFEEDEAAAPPAASPEPPKAPDPPAEPEAPREFPSPLPAPEPEAAPAERPRISPMRESLLSSGGASSRSSAFLAYPKPPPAAAPAAAPAQAPAAAPAPPKRRRFRALSGP